MQKENPGVKKWQIDFASKFWKLFNSWGKSWHPRGWFPILPHPIPTWPIPPCSTNARFAIKHANGLQPTHVLGFSSVQLESWKGSLGSLTSDTGNAQVATSDQRRFAWGQTWIWLWFASSTPTRRTHQPHQHQDHVQNLQLEVLWKCLIRSHCSTYANLKAHSHDWRTNGVTKRTNMKHTQQTTLYSPKRCFWFHSHLTLQVR